MDEFSKKVATLNPVERALILAFIKLVQTGGFEEVNGVKTPDKQAYNQILDAIHTFWPEFGAGTEGIAIIILT